MAKRLKINGILATGISHSGKGTLLKLLEEALYPHHSGGQVSRVSMGDIIVWGSDLSNKIGEDVRREQLEVLGGGRFSDGVLIRLFDFWLASELERDPQINTVLMSDAPRSVPQLNAFTSFDKWAVIHVKLGCETARHINLKRSEKGGRVNEAVIRNVFERRWNQYRDDTLSALSQLKKSTVHVDYHDPISIKLKHVLHHLSGMGKEKSPIPQKLVSHALARLEVEDHPIHERIRAVQMF